MDNEHDEPDYLAIWIAGMDIQLTGQCAFCGKYADLVLTTCDDLVCDNCRDEFESALEELDDSDEM